MLPAIYFIFSRAACDDAVAQCVREGKRLTTVEERRQIRAIAEDHVDALSDDDLSVLDYGGWLTGLEAGYAAHHAGMVPPFKEAVEACFAAGLVKAVFATETLSLGINMPARSVVIEKLTKFTGERHEFLTPGEYTQLTGRAGRRGIDDVGYAVVLWSPFVPFDQVAGLAGARSYALTSSFRPTYNMAANLVRRYPPDVAHHLLNLSFAQYRADSDVVRLEAQLERIRGGPRPRPGGLAACERGDVEEYRRLLRASEESARQRPSMTAEVTAALERVRPGRRAHRAGRQVRRPGGGAVHRRGAGAVTSGSGPSPPIAGWCRSDPATSRPRPRPWPRSGMPVPYAPHNAGFQRQVASALIAARLRDPGGGVGSPVAAPAVAGRGGHGPGDRGRRPPGGRLPRRPDPPAGARAGRPAGPGHRPARAAGQGPDRVAGPAVRPGPAGAGGVGLRRRLVVDRRRASAWPGSTTSRICWSPSACGQGLLDGLEPAELAGLVSVFTYEARGPGEPSPWFPTARCACAGRRSTGWRPSSTRPRKRPACRSPAGPTLASSAWPTAGPPGRHLADVIADEEMSGRRLRAQRQAADRPAAPAARTWPAGPATAAAARQATAGSVPRRGGRLLGPQRLTRARAPAAVTAIPHVGVGPPLRLGLRYGELGHAAPTWPKSGPPKRPRSSGGTSPTSTGRCSPWSTCPRSSRGPSSPATPAPARACAASSSTSSSAISTSAATTAWTPPSAWPGPSSSTTGCSSSTATTRWPSSAGSTWPASRPPTCSPRSSSGAG